MVGMQMRGRDDMFGFGLIMFKVVPVWAIREDTL